MQLLCTKYKNWQSVGKECQCCGRCRPSQGRVETSRGQRPPAAHELYFAGALGVKNYSLYNASKSAVIGIVRAFATDFGTRGITINGLAPASVKSDMFTENAWRYVPGSSPDWPAEKIESMVANACPWKRCAVRDDIARVVGFLQLEDTSWVNGKRDGRSSPVHRCI